MPGSALSVGFTHEKHAVTAVSGKQTLLLRWMRCVQLLNSPGFENAGRSPAYVDIWERQCGLWILHRFNMALVHQQDDLLRLVVYHWHLCKRPNADSYSNTYCDSFTGWSSWNGLPGSLRRRNLPHGIVRRLFVALASYSPNVEAHCWSQSHTLGAGSHSLSLKGRIYSERKR